MLKIDCGAKTTVIVTLNIFYDKANHFSSFFLFFKWGNMLY